MWLTKIWDMQGSLELQEEFTGDDWSASNLGGWTPGVGMGRGLP